MQITYADSTVLGKTPARVNRLTGEIFINTDVWDTLPGAYQDFILAHEEGHYQAQTVNELMADHYAIMKLAGTAKNSLRNAVNTICEVLPGNNDIQQLRILNIYRLALLWDSLHSPQPDTDSELENIREAVYAYRNLTELKDYEMILNVMRKGKPTDYEFPGYDSNMFEPAVGSRFMDVPLSESEIKSAFQQRYGITGADMSATGTATGEAAEPEACDLMFLPNFESELTIDLKTLLIAACIILIFVLINKLSK
ncbi:MAG: hypothetical protein AB7U05_08970 [Mangrovibacterium sp.]